MLSPLQKTKLTWMFKVLDSDGSGFLEHADGDRLAHNIATERGWQPGTEPYEALKSRYQMWLQRSGPFMQNGRLDLTGYLAFHDALLNMPGGYDSTIRGLTEFVFDALDADADGMVTIIEMKQLYHAYGIDLAIAESAFSRMDTNRDGFISRGEMMDLAAQFYFSSDPTAPGNNLFGPISAATST